jgi:hypothetical protein
MFCRLSVCVVISIAGVTAIRPVAAGNRTWHPGIEASIEQYDVGQVLRGSTSAPQCAWEEIDRAPGEASEDPEVEPSSQTTRWPRVKDDRRRYRLYIRVCPDGQSLHEIPEIGASDVLPSLLSDLQTRALPRPQIEYYLDERGWWYANLPLDVRVPNTAPVSVTASLPAPISLSLTVTATPTAVTFSPGEPRGSAVSCTSAAAVAPMGQGGCSYTYKDSSSIEGDLTFTGSVSVEWAVTYAGTVGAGTRPSLTTTASRDISIGEIQAILTG